jgi:hypothetical protein
VKGFTHLVSGVAAASFLPQVVCLSAEGQFVLLWAALGGIMPDTLDFKLARYLEKPDLEILPDANDPDLQGIARSVAAATDLAYQQDRVVRVQFHTLKLGANLWRQYSVGFQGHKVSVGMGPLINTSQVAFSGSDLGLAVGCARAAVPIRYDHGHEIQVDSFAGPTVELRRRDDGVEVSFLPWHRRWSHSLTLAALLGVVIALFFGQLGGLAYALGSLVHILQDQLGHMGSNLFYPFTRRRTAGFKLFHSGDVLPNLLTVWLGAVLILYNLDRFSAASILRPSSLFLGGLIVPWTVILSWVWLRREKERSRLARCDDRNDELLAEMEEME